MNSFDQSQFRNEDSLSAANRDSVSASNSEKHCKRLFGIVRHLLATAVRCAARNLYALSLCEIDIWLYQSTTIFNLHCESGAAP